MPGAVLGSKITMQFKDLIFKDLCSLESPI